MGEGSQMEGQRRGSGEVNKKGGDRWIERVSKKCT